MAMAAAINGMACCLADNVSDTGWVVGSSFGASEPWALYWASVTFSIHCTLLPSTEPVTARCVMALVGAAPCQCLTPGGQTMTSPGRISCTGLPHSWTRPTPDVTTKRWPAGWVCHAERAPGSKLT
ncbi:hypothetical protein D3C85_1194850 [compost metagenome]